MLDALVSALRRASGIAHKRDIAPVLHDLFPTHAASADGVRVGDDCAALPDGNGWLLFAIEGFQNEFVRRDPYFAGYCGVMVNVSDIYAMGGRPLAVVDALWSRDHEHARPLLEGLRAAASIYETPVVGGHSNTRSDGEQFAVAVLGRADHLMTSFDAQPGDALVVAIDLRGRYRDPFPHWDASTGADPERLRTDLGILPRLAADGLCAAAKDISQAGVIGTALMLLEGSGVGAVIDVSAIPTPPAASTERWLLSTFPSYGFVLAVPAHAVTDVCSRFHSRDIACAVVGHCDNTRSVRLRAGVEERVVWNFREDALVGCGPPSLSTPSPMENAHA